MTTTASPQAAAPSQSAPVQAADATEKPSTQPTAQETAAAIKKYKVKVDGQEMEVDENELLNGYGHNKAAEKRMREAAMLKKQNEEFISMLRDPAQALKVLGDPRLGHDVRKLAEAVLLEQLEEEQMDPKDKLIRDQKRIIEAAEEEKKKQKQKMDDEEMAAMEAKFSEDYSAKIVKSLETSGLPKTRHTVKRMAYYMNEGFKRNFDLQPDDVVELVKRDYLHEQKELLGGLDGDLLEKMLDSSIADKIRKHDIAKVKGLPKTASKHVVPSTGGSNDKPKMTKEEWKEKLRLIKEA